MLLLPITGGEAVEFSGGRDNEESDGGFTENWELTSFLHETIASFTESNLSTAFALNSFDLHFSSSHVCFLLQVLSPNLILMSVELAGGTERFCFLLLLFFFCCFYWFWAKSIYEVCFFLWFCYVKREKERKKYMRDEKKKKNKVRHAKRFVLTELRHVLTHVELPEGAFYIWESVLEW